MALPDPLPIQPLSGPFDATVRPPGSKSITNRALVIAALAEGASTLTGVLFSDDSRYMMQALQDLGFELEIDEPNTTVIVHGKGGHIPNHKAELFLGNSGTSIRFLAAMVCLGHGIYTLDGVERMRQRPIGPLVDSLRKLNATIGYMEADGCPPIRVNAHGLDGGGLTITPTLSSQYTSAMMMAGVHMNRGLVLSFEGPPISWPYIDMTLAVMGLFAEGYAPLGEQGDITIKRGVYKAGEIDIEPDASAASYFFAAAATNPGSRITLDKLGPRSVQGDTRFAEVLQQMGAVIETTDGSITLTGPERLEGIDVDLNDIPDAAMTLAAIAPLADGPTVIRNVGNWRVKETDRMAALCNELTKVGAIVSVDGDDLHVYPPEAGTITPAEIETYDDHRMAMCFSVLGLAREGIKIKDPACVNKTYPGFFADLELLRQGVRA